MNIRNFDLNLLITFDALMRERSVSRAAKQLSLTQPAVSNALNRLRHLLDDPLLVRTQRGMAPTSRALELLGPIQTALGQLDQCLTSPTPFEPATSQQQFVLGATDYVAMLLLPDFLAQLRQQAPGVELQIKNLGAIGPEQALETGQYDFALGRFLKDQPRLHRERWLQDQLCCLVRRDHPATLSPLDLTTFVGLEFIWVTTTERRSLVDSWLAQQQLQRRITLTIPSYTTGAMIVAESDMGLVLPRRFAQKFARSLPVTALMLPNAMDLANFDVDLLWHPLHASSPAHIWLRQQLRQAGEALSHEESP